jgi:hypothetical protein
MKVMWSSKAKSVVDDCKHCDRKCVRVRVSDRKCDRCVDQSKASKK